MGNQKTTRLHSTKSPRLKAAAPREKEETLRAFIESSFDIIFTLNKEGVFDYISPAWERHFGYPVSDAMGKTLASFVHPDDLATFTEYLKTVLDTGKSPTSPSYRVKHADGNWRWVITNGTPHVSPKGDLLFIGVGRDVTEQKKAEEKLKERFKELNCLYNLSALIESPGVSLEEILKKTVSLIQQAWQFPEITEARIVLEGQIFQTEHFRETSWMQTQKIMVNGNPVGQIEVCYLQKRPASDEGPFLIEERQLLNAVAERIDHVIERNKTEEKLRESEERIRAITDSAHDAILMMDKDGNISYWNSAAEHILGYTSVESVGRNLHELIAPERFIPAHLAAFPEFQQTGRGNAIGKTLELAARRKDGQEIDVELSLSAMKIKKAWHAVGIIHDITERKQLLDKIIQSEERYRTILDEMEDGYYEIDLAGNYTFVNDTNARHLGYSKEELIGLNFRVGMPEESIETVKEVFSNIYMTGIPQRGISYKALRKDGTTGFAEISGFPVKNEKGEIIGFRGLAIDITERKRAEEELSQSEEKYRTILENIEDGYVELDLKGNFIFFNDALCKIQGYPKDELMKLSYRDLMDKENARKIYKEYNKVFTTGQSGKEVDYEVITKNGERKYLETSITPMKDDLGQVVAFRGIVRDRTERKQAETQREAMLDALRENEEQLRGITENIPGLIFRFYTTDIGEYGVSFFGGRLKEFFGDTPDVNELFPYFISHVYDEDRDQLLKSIETAVKQEIPWDYVGRLRTESGETIWFRGMSTPARYKNQLVFDGIILNITEQKNMQEALCQSEEKYRTILENMQESYYELDLAGNLTFVNDAVCRNMGYSKDELIGMNYRQYTEKEELQRVFEAYHKVYDTGEPLDEFGWQIIRKDGTKMYIEGSVALKKDSEGKIIGFKGLHHDVTERKKIEWEIRASEEKYRTIIEQMTDGYFETDISGNFTLVNDAECINLGYSREELIGRDRKLYADEKTDKALYRLFVEVYKTGIPVNAYAVEITKKDGSKAFHEISVSLIRNSKGEPSGFRGIVRDITERKLTEKILRENEERLRGITKNLPGIVYQFYAKDSGEYGMSYVSERLNEYLGITTVKLDEMFPLFVSHVHEEDRDRYLASIQTAVETCTPWNFEGRVFDITWGVMTWFKCLATPTRYEDQIVFDGILLDITESKQVESQKEAALEALLRSETKFRTLYDSTSDAVMLLDEKGFFDCNKATLRIFGCATQEEFISKRLSDFSPVTQPGGANSMALANQMIAKAMERGCLRFEWTHKRNDTGEIFPAEVLLNTMEVDGKRILQAVVRDITERKKAEDAIRKSEEKFKQLAEVFPETIFEADMAGAVTYTNKHGLNQFGFTEEDVAKGVNIFELVAPQDRQLALDQVQKRIEGKRQGYLEYQAMKKDGSTFYAIALAVPIIHKGVPIGIRGFILDITDRKKVEEKLLEVNRRLEAAIADANEMAVQAKMANRSKSDFLANVSHEIRTPMNAIIGMADLLWDSNLTTDQRQYVQIFRSAGENLLTLINDILDLSKVESGQMTLEHINYDVIDTIEKTCEVVALRANSKNLELICHITPEVPQHIQGDPTRLRQVLINILGNAVKFTEKGEIVLTVEPVPQSVSKNANRFLQFSIQDTGIGIPDDKLEAVFEKFTQSDSSITRKYEGTGLGLAISKQLVEMMGGKIWMQSKQGEGSTFFFTIPLETATIGKDYLPALAPEVNLHGLNILIVDDNATNRLILRETLQQWGCIVTEAAGGKDALKELKKAKQKNVLFHIAILDSQMPEMDGFTLAHKIRSKPEFMTINLLMLSSERRSSDRIRAKSVDILAYLIKPVKREALKNALQVAADRDEILRKIQIPQAQEKIFKDETLPLHILLVDDSEDNRFLVQAYLKNTNYKLDTAENGRIAIDKFQSHVYDLILMDVQMPEMDGYTATKEIRLIEKEKKLKCTPIIALTAHALKEDEEKSLAAGCDAHLTKPIRKPVLLETLQKYLSAGDDGKKV